MRITTLMALIVAIPFVHFATPWRLGGQSLAAEADDTYQKIENVFVGHPSREVVRPMMESVLHNFSAPNDPANVEHLASILVLMRKNTGIAELRTLSCMIGLEDTFGQDYASGAALCATGVSLQ